MKGGEGLTILQKRLHPNGAITQAKILVIVENVIKLKNLFSNMIMQNSCKNLRKQKKKSLFSKFEKKLR